MSSGKAGSRRDPRKRPVVTEEEVTAFLKEARALQKKLATQKRVMSACKAGVDYWRTPWRTQLGLPQTWRPKG